MEGQGARRRGAAEGPGRQEGRVAHAWPGGGTWQCIPVKGLRCLSLIAPEHKGEVRGQATDLALVTSSTTKGPPATPPPTPPPPSPAPNHSSARPDL